MNFQSIQYFLQVARRRSFSQAAEELFITQQTLSASIASLEKELGCRLFLRHIPLELTYGGELFLQYATAYWQEYEHMNRDFAELGAGVRGCLRVGVASVRGRLLLPKVIHAFHELHPLVEVEVVEGKNDALLEALLEGEIDLAIADFPGACRGVAMEPYYEDEIVLALSNGLLKAHFGDRTEEQRAALVKTRDIRLLADVPFLMSSALSVSGRIARKLIRQAGILPKIKATSGNMETLIEMCRLGEGACFCSEKLLTFLLDREQLKTMTVLRFPDGGTRHTVQFGWPEQEKAWGLRSDFVRLAKRAETV
jgi:DNA-binding transcriptional LysR family regulator